MATRIGLLGGTFDPVHRGHISIVKSFLNSGMVDEIWILPAPSPPHKLSDDITGYPHRKKMLELAFRDIDNVIVNDIEQKLTLPSYTIQTIRFLKQKHPEKTFYLCIGEDSLANFDTWHKAEQIVQECDLLVAERPGSNHADVDKQFLEKAHFVEHSPVEISGTQLRENILNRRNGVEEYIPSQVLSYIREHRLYQN